MAFAVVDARLISGSGGNAGGGVGCGIDSETFGASNFVRAGRTGGGTAGSFTAVAAGAATTGGGGGDGVGFGAGGMNSLAGEVWALTGDDEDCDFPGVGGATRGIKFRGFNNCSANNSVRSQRDFRGWGAGTVEVCFAGGGDEARDAAAGTDDVIDACGGEVSGRSSTATGSGALSPGRRSV